jgi:oligopeptide transport system substrate-binding protein
MLSQGVVRMMFSGLAYLDQEMTPQLDLARSYSASKDFKTYTFILKKSYWSDGSLVTARDFEESWKTALTPTHASTNSNLFYFIKNAKKAMMQEIALDQVGVHALDDQTLVVELEKPHPHFLNVVINSVFYPVHKTLRDHIFNPKNLICSGPFRLKTYLLQDQIILEKNPHYWDADHIQLEGIDYVIIRDPATALIMFEKKQLDWIGDPLMRLSADAVPDLKSKGLLHTLPAGGTHWLFFNTDKYPLNNVNLRKALAYAIDRKKILTDLFHDDRTSPALGLMPQILKKKRWHPWFQDNDTKKAKELFEKGLKELRITAQELPPITLYYANNLLWSKVIQAIQQMWKEHLGIEVKCEGCDGQIFLKQIYSYTHDIARFGWVMQYDDPSNLLETFKFKHNRPNVTAWEDPRYIQHTDASYVEDEEEKWRHVEIAEKIFFDAMPSIPITEMFIGYIQQPYVKGVNVNYLYQINFRWTHLEQEPSPHGH